MRYTLLKNQFNPNAVPFKVQSSRTGWYYGTANTSADGSPMFKPVPCYRESNPKIDLFASVPDGNGAFYLASTNQFRTVRDALQFYKGVTIKGRSVARASIDKRSR